MTLEQTYDQMSTASKSGTSSRDLWFMLLAVVAH